MSATVSFPLTAERGPVPAICVITGDTETVSFLPITLPWQSAHALWLYFVLPFVAVFLPARQVEVVLPFSKHGYRRWLLAERLAVGSWAVCTLLLFLAVIALATSLLLAVAFAAAAVLCPVALWLGLMRFTKLRCTSADNTAITIKIPNEVAAERINAVLRTPPDDHPAPANESSEGSRFSEEERPEKKIGGVHYQLSAEHAPFGITITDRSVFWLVQKRYRHYADHEHLPFAHHEVRGFMLVPIKPYSLWLLASAMVVVGSATSFWMINAMASDHAGVLSGFPFAVFAVGLAIPFITRGRRRLIMFTTKGAYHWTPPLVVGPQSRKEVARALDSVIVFARQAGLPTSV